MGINLDGVVFGTHAVSEAMRRPARRRDRRDRLARRPDGHPDGPDLRGQQARRRRARPRDRAGAGRDGIRSTPSAPASPTRRSSTATRMSSSEQGFPIMTAEEVAGVVLESAAVRRRRASAGSCSSTTTARSSSAASPGRGSPREPRRRQRARLRPPGRRPAVLRGQLQAQAGPARRRSSAPTASARRRCMRILAGELQPEDGEIGLGGRVAYMAQDVGQDDGTTVRELLLSVAPRALADAGPPAARRRARRWPPARRRPPAWRSARRSATGRPPAATSSRASGTPPAGGSSARRSTTSATAPAPRSPAASASAWSSTCCSTGDAEILLLDEPDNFLDIPAKRGARAASSGTTPKTILLISHDRELLAGAVEHDRHARGPRRLGPRRLLRDLPRGARAPPAAARRRAAALEGRGAPPLPLLQAAEGARALLARSGRRRPTPPRRAGSASSTPARRPAPVTDQQIKVRLRGGDSARRVHRLPRAQRSTA